MVKTKQEQNTSDVKEQSQHLASGYLARFDKWVNEIDYAKQWKFVLKFFFVSGLMLLLSFAIMVQCFVLG